MTDVELKKYRAKNPFIEMMEFYWSDKPIRLLPSPAFSLIKNIEYQRAVQMQLRDLAIKATKEFILSSPTVAGDSSLKNQRRANTENVQCQSTPSKT